MALADVFEAIAGPEAPVEFRAYDGSSAGMPGAPVRITVRSPVAVSYLAQAPGALGLARAYVSGHLDVDGDMYTALARMTSAQADFPGHSRTAAAAGRARRPEGALAQGPAAAAGSAGEPQVAGRPAALQGPRRQRDLAPLRRVEPLLRVGARAVDGLHLRLLPAGGCLARGGAGVQVRPGRAQDRAARGHAAAGRGMRLGRHGHARGQGVRGQGARGDAVGPAGVVGAAGHRRGRAVRAGRGPAPRLPRRARDRVRRGELDRADRAHRQGTACRATSPSCTASSSRAAGCSTTASPGPMAPSRPGAAAGSSTGTCSRTGSWRAPGT